ncbi:hypothetical protein FRC03_002118 [Tulasnella sp. 419]|nr:hypothetical protein FRC02_011036 [Tulasnella sp. 418]KAG8944289.1 hypothetical protein FRC03_002118 [Tulasnella sp. 419]
MTQHQTRKKNLLASTWNQGVSVISESRPQSGKVHHDASSIDRQTIEELIYHIGIHASRARVLEDGPAGLPTALRWFLIPVRITQKCLLSGAADILTPLNIGGSHRDY